MLKCLVQLGGTEMKNIDEIKKAQDTIKNQLTRETEEKGISFLQGQFAALDWVITEEEKEKEE